MALNLENISCLLTKKHGKTKAQYFPPPSLFKDRKTEWQYYFRNTYSLVMMSIFSEPEIRTSA